MKLLAWLTRRNILVDQDATSMIDVYREDAYDEARTLVHSERTGKTIPGLRPAGHWDKVRAEIKRRTKPMDMK